MRHFIFDVDGVLILAPVFTENLYQKYHIPVEQSLSFIQGEYQECVVGKKDLKAILPAYIAGWGLTLSVDELLAFWFESENKPNSKLIQFVQDLRSEGYACSVATNQEKYRTGYLRHAMRFGEYFDRIFASNEIGCKKPDNDYYRIVAQELGTDSGNITFFDDRPNYVESAKVMGWDAHVFENTDAAIQIIQEMKVK